MSMGNTFENDILQLIYNAVAIANLADNAGSAPATNLYYVLHSADPGEGGDQSTNEVAYTGYARQAAVRSSSGLTVSGNQVSNAAQIQWGQCSAGSTTARFWSIGMASSGAGKILHRGVLGSALGSFVADADDTFTIKGHGLAVSDLVCFLSRPGDTLPTGIGEGTHYYVKTVPDADTITISATNGGPTIDLTADGEGVAFKMSPLVISLNVNPTAAIGALVYTLD